MCLIVRFWVGVKIHQWVCFLCSVREAVIKLSDLLFFTFVLFGTWCFLDYCAFSNTD